MLKAWQATGKNPTARQEPDFPWKIDGRSNARDSQERRHAESMTSDWQESYGGGSAQAAQQACRISEAHKEPYKTNFNKTP